MKYVFDPKILHEVALAHLELPLEDKFAAIAQSLAGRHGNGRQSGVVAQTLIEPRRG